MNLHSLVEKNAMTNPQWLPERLAAAAHIFRPENPASRIRAMAELGRIVNHVPARMLAMGSARSAAGLILAQD